MKKFRSSLIFNVPMHCEMLQNFCKFCSLDNVISKRENEFIVYLDANNRYLWAMSQSLPAGNFKWVKNVDEFGVMNIAEDSPTRHILEVDLGREFSHWINFSKPEYTLLWWIIVCPYYFSYVAKVWHEQQFLKFDIE